jgi:predicted nucleic acid-binding Zn ribbon protein
VRPLDPPDPRRLGESLDDVARSVGGAPAMALATLFGSWAAVVGHTVAAHSRPLSLTRGTLAIAVDEPGWATQLAYLETDLLRRMDEALGSGVVTAIRVRVVPRRR